MSLLDDATRLQLLRKLEQDATLSQRELARELGISLGKVNYCLKALIDKGYVKAGNFRRSRHKSAYLYKLTPEGIAAKARATRSFLHRKQQEYEALAEEIEALRREVQSQ